MVNNTTHNRKISGTVLDTVPGTVSTGGGHTVRYKLALATGSKLACSIQSETSHSQYPTMTPLTTLMGEDLGEEMRKWNDTVYCKADGHVYGIPREARRVIKFNPADRSHTMIGPDLGPW